jgi:NAD-dependent DNA ligase
MIKIEVPTTCPSCASELEEVNFQMFCRGKSCPAQTAKTVEAYAKKMKLKGLGPKTIETLELDSIPDIYDLEEDYIVHCLGQKTGEKVYAIIKSTTNVDFDMYLSALSIPLIGATASRKVGTVANTLSEITDSKLLEAGLGLKARANLMNWLNNNIHEYENLVTFSKKKPKTIIKPLGSVVITGKLNDFKNRTEASNFLRDKGYTVLSGVTNKVNYLICEDGSSSSKSTKAETLNIEICTIKQLMEK